MTFKNIFNQIILSPHQLFLSINAISIIAIAYLFTELWTALLFVPTLSQSDLSTAKKATGIDQQTVKLDIDRIATFPLFGKISSRKSDVATIQAPETVLNLKLLSIISGNPASVIIKEGKKPGRTYQVEDVINGKIKISAILENRVLLERDGKLETLNFAKGKSNGIAINEIDNTSSFIDSNDRQTDYINNSYTDQRFTLPSNQTPRGNLNRPRNNSQLPKNNSPQYTADKLLTLVSPEQAEKIIRDVETGTPIALSNFSHLLKSNELQRYGLKPDDKLIAVNGQALSSILNNPASISHLVASKQLNLKILRNNKPMAFKITLR